MSSNAARDTLRDRDRALWYDALVSLALALLLALSTFVPRDGEVQGRPTAAVREVGGEVHAGGFGSRPELVRDAVHDELGQGLSAKNVPAALDAPRPSPARAATTPRNYDAWGNYQGGAPPTGPPTLGFATHQWDPAAGLVYAKARWYAPEIGRLLSEDPVGLTGDRLLGPMGLHPFGYANGNPLRWNDPTGMLNDGGLGQERLAATQVKINGKCARGDESACSEVKGMAAIGVGAAAVGGVGLAATAEVTLSSIATTVLSWVGHQGGGQVVATKAIGAGLTAVGTYDCIQSGGDLGVCVNALHTAVETWLTFASSQPRNLGPNSSARPAAPAKDPAASRSPPLRDPGNMGSDGDPFAVEPTPPPRPAPAAPAAAAPAKPPYGAKEPEVQDFIGRFKARYPGRDFESGHRRADSTGKLVEIDFETDNAIIEMKGTKGQGLPRQVARRQDKTLNPQQKVCFGVACHPKGMNREVRDAIDESGGVSADKDQIDTLLEAIAPDPK